MSGLLITTSRLVRVVLRSVPCTGSQQAASRTDEGVKAGQLQFFTLRRLICASCCVAATNSLHLPGIASEDTQCSTTRTVTSKTPRLWRCETSAGNKALLILHRAVRLALWTAMA